MSATKNSSIPRQKANGVGLDLLHERPATRGTVDLVLSDATKGALGAILLEHERKKELGKYGLLPARKLLFCGPPGCGKTLAAEVVANHLSLPLAVVGLDSVMNSYLGNTASNLRKVFDYIAEHPMVTLFDEVDAITKDRGDIHDVGEIKRATNSLLQMMDDYRGDGILIAATNYESLLDKAVWRRFDEIIRFNLPDLDQRNRLVEKLLAKVRRDFDINATRMAGMSHAIVERIMIRSIKMMVLDGEKIMRQRHFDAALERERGQ